MPLENQPFAAYQAAFAARLRDPKNVPRPAGAPARRMRVYQELLFNNLEGFLLACYPVTRQLLGSQAWKRTVRAFFMEHRCHSPLFRDIPKAFLDWMTNAGAARLPKLPFLAEFMHYEWLELAVSIAPDETSPSMIDPEGDLLAGRPALSAGARLAIYRYPVHRIGPRYQPAAPDGAAHHYLLYRDSEDEVRFVLLNALSVRLLGLIRDQRLSGHAALLALAENDPPSHIEPFLQAGGDLLAQLRDEGALLGTWRKP